MEGLQTISEAATRRSSRWHSTADFFGRSRIIFPSGAAVRRRSSGWMCRRLCVDACQAGKPHPAEVVGQDFFNGSDSEGAFAPLFSTRDGNRCLTRMIIFCELSGDWRTAPERPLVVSLTIIYHGSFEIGRSAGMGWRQTICVAMPRRGADGFAPRASMVSSRSCGSSFASWFCEASARPHWCWPCRQSRITVTNDFPRSSMKANGGSFWRPSAASLIKADATILSHSASLTWVCAGLRCPDFASMTSTGDFKHSRSRPPKQVRGDSCPCRHTWRTLYTTIFVIDHTLRPSSCLSGKTYCEGGHYHRGPSPQRWIELTAAAASLAGLARIGCAIPLPPDFMLVVRPPRRLPICSAID